MPRGHGIATEAVAGVLDAQERCYPDFLKRERPTEWQMTVPATPVTMPELVFKQTT